MAKITFLNSTKLNRTVEGSQGESLLDIALNNDIPVAHACGGFCSCTTCHVIVKSGGEHLTPFQDDELERLDTLDERKNESRLGCQARLLTEGDVTVEVMNLDEY